ncbi:MAG: DmsE family decaheme c-type cytochrome [Acidobacteriota bacterium]
MDDRSTKTTKTIKRVLFLLALAASLSLVLIPSDDPSLAQDLDLSEEVAGERSPSPGQSSECATCHDQIATDFARTVHGKARGGASCESCHGNGAEHIAGGGDVTKIKNPAKLKAAEVSKTCAECHSQIKEHAIWRGSKHEAAGLSCLSCHSAHHSKAVQTADKFAAFAENPRAETRLLKMRNEAETCYQCHSDIRKAQYQRSTHLFRNEDREHRLNCSSCHEPHGSIGPKMMRTASTNETCYECHTDKRGPFLWEHSPAREDCSVCHKAHGSNHNALLQTRAPMLCQQCHIQGRHQTVAGVPNSAWSLNRSCLNCHPAVHGSNHPSGVNLQR